MLPFTATLAIDVDDSADLNLDNVPDGDSTFDLNHSR
jgi:hypothetical protein